MTGGRKGVQDQTGDQIVVLDEGRVVAKGKLESAIREYRKVLAENPNDANTLNRVGDLYARIERFDEAVEVLEGARHRDGSTEFAEQRTETAKKPKQTKSPP